MKRIDLAYMGRSSAAPVHIAACDNGVLSLHKVACVFRVGGGQSAAIVGEIFSMNDSD